MIILIIKLAELESLKKKKLEKWQLLKAVRSLILLKLKNFNLKSQKGNIFIIQVKYKGGKRMRSKIFTAAVFLLIFVFSSTVNCQNPVKERPDLIQDLIEQSQIFSFAGEEEPDGIPENVSVTIYQYDGTAEEALRYVNEVLFKDDNRKPEMESSKMFLSEFLLSIKMMAEKGFSPGLDEEWLKKAEEEIVKLEGIEQESYYGYLEYPDMDKDVTIQSPFFNPVSFELLEGTYIIYTESKFAEAGEYDRGAKVDISNKLAENFLKGSWEIQKRAELDMFENQVPEIKIEIDKLIGSFEETEIEAERYLFSGQIEVNGIKYKAFSELDPVNVFAYPVRIISVLKEEAIGYHMEIWVEDTDQNIDLSISSDFEEAYERALAVEIYYSNNKEGEDYHTDDDSVDYLIRE